MNKLNLHILVPAFLLLMCPNLYAQKKHSAEFYSDTYTADRIYKSMLGPRATKHIYLLESKKPELIWITGYDVNVVNPVDMTPLSDEYICHSNLEFNEKAHNDAFGQNDMFRKRLFSLSQGQGEISFPSGFGVPVMADQPLELTTQLLNLNHSDQEVKLKHKITIDYLRDSELTEPIKPLFLRAGVVMVLLEGKDGFPNIDKPTQDVMAAECSSGEKALSFAYDRLDPFGRRFASHWIVKPGRHVYRTLVTKKIRIPFDTTLHYISVHLHPFGESIELRDITDDKTVYKGEAINFTDKIGIKKVGYFSSEKGIPIYKNHDYELISVYNNTTDEDQDAMASMFLYMLNHKFNKPGLASLPD